VKNDDLGNIGSRIKKVRMQMGLNQEAFAKKLSLGGPTVVSKYEKNQREPEIAILVKIAQLGNKSLDWLLTGKSSVKQKPVEKKLGEIIAQVDRIYREGNTKKLSAVKYILDMADPDPVKKKKN
jgi:transcriptional regulator with XRE-family HTH domain